ncbi:MAG TPA: diguanylate cyclase [Fimbriimonas sp.]|nr:diguanylate cyclase [Fimbriimonas sp.]
MDLLAATGSVPRVLVVEDDPVSAMLVQRLLAAQNIPVDRAPDGLVALQMHRERPYRLIISDWMMPEMDGIQLCREFRKLKEQYVYFILCSAKGERADRLEAFGAGVDDVLSKPLDREELHARLNVARRILATEEDLQQQKAELEQSSKLLQDMNECLKLASRRFEELFNGLPVASFTFDEDGRIHEWNKAAQEVFGIPAFEAIQKPIWEVLNRRGHSLWSPEKVAEVFVAGAETSFDWTFQVREGVARYLACNLICLRGRNGEAVGAVCANLDVTERKLAERQSMELAERLELQKVALEDANERLNHLAVTDGLTALWNHRRFQQMLDEALVALHDRSEPFSLVLLDIDHFKKLNDQFGHQVGDDVLIDFAGTLQKTARANELPARYGGEEFAIILQGCDRAHALQAAERFRTAILKGSWNTRSVTCSLGVASADDLSMTSREIIAQADAALYFSKQSGRNRTTHYDAMAKESAAA